MILACGKFPDSLDFFAEVIQKKCLQGFLAFLNLLLVTT
jgi:hypothetical protein